MNIGAVINKYRKEKHMTQEDLANRLGVSAPAVNKWENGKTLPDVMLLAPIARLLDVSLDELLSFRSDLLPEEIRGYVQDAEADLSEETYRDVLLRSRDLIRSFPNCSALALNLATLLDNYSRTHSLPDDPERDELLVSWYKQGLDSESPDIRSACADALFKYHVREFQYEEARKYLLDVPDQGPVNSLKQARLYEEAGNRTMSLRFYEQFLLDACESLREVLAHLARLKLAEDDPEGAAVFVVTQRELSRIFDLGDFAVAFSELDMVLSRKDPKETLSYIYHLIHTAQDISPYVSSPLYSHVFPDDKAKERQLFQDNSNFDFFMSTLDEDERFSYMDGDPQWENLLSAWAQSAPDF